MGSVAKSCRSTMSNISKPLLARFINKFSVFGGTLKLISPKEYTANYADKSTCSDFYHCPLSSYLGIDWIKVQLVGVRSNLNVGAVIHEMGHLFASNTNPSDTDTEFDFFGWEIALARELRCYSLWSTDSANYIIDDGVYWGRASIAVQREVAAEQLTKAKQRGLVNARGRATSLRSMKRAKHVD